MHNDMAHVTEALHEFIGKGRYRDFAEKATATAVRNAAEEIYRSTNASGTRIPEAAAPSNEPAAPVPRSGTGDLTAARIPAQAAAAAGGGLPLPVATANAANTAAGAAGAAPSTLPAGLHPDVGPYQILADHGELDVHAALITGPFACCITTNWDDLFE